MNNFDNVYWIETIFRGVIINIKLLKMKKSIKNLNTKTLPHLEASKICGGTNNQTDNEKQNDKVKVYWTGITAK